MGKGNYAICQSCGKKADYTECSQRCTMPEAARCAVLSGWLSVSHWKGTGAVDYYHLCSLTCLQKWVDSRVPKVPEIFLKAFEGD